MGIFEILLIAVVTLLVVGPERMPEAVRSIALTMGRAKRMFNNAKAEIEKQVGADEIRQELHNEAVMERLAKEDQAKQNQTRTQTEELAPNLDGVNITPVDTSSYSERSDSVKDV